MENKPCTCSSVFHLHKQKKLYHKVTLCFPLDSTGAGGRLFACLVLLMLLAFKLHEIRHALEAEE